MTNYYAKHATTEEIKARFDNSVDRFSNLDTGQQTTIDAPLMMDLCTEAAAMVNPQAKELLDIGCGAGNYTLKMLQKLPHLNCTLNDLSLPMLQKAQERIAPLTNGTVTVLQDDMRNLRLPDGHFDIVLAATTLHHLRGDADWELMFKKVFALLKDGGSFWVSDLIIHDTGAINSLFRQKYSRHLEALGGPDFCRQVWEYVDYEDTPRSLNYQLGLLAKVGFRNIEILHKNALFAAFGGVK